MKTVEMLLIEDAAFYDAQMNPIKLKMYVEKLKAMHPHKVEEAMEFFRSEKGRRQMPMPADIIAFFDKKHDAKDLARITSLRIREAVTKFGWCNASQAKEHIGPTGWAIVERFGGWLHICENLGVNIQEGTFLAQTRDALESEITLQRSGVNTSQPAIEQSKQNPQLEAVVKQLAQARSMEEK